jgi:hypothetical protein
METNCWLVVLAQHPNAAGHFIHYESPRMRREAKADTKKLVTDFNMTISSLISARRKDAIEMGKALALAEKQRGDAEAEAESSHQALERQQDELQKKETEMAEKDMIIAKYKRILGCSEISQESSS